MINSVLVRVCNPGPVFLDLQSHGHTHITAMKTFLIWLIIDCLVMIALVCSYLDFLAPFSIYLAFALTLIAVFIIVFGLIKKKRQLTYTAIAVPVSLLIAFGVLRFQENRRLTNASKIITAVEAYRAIHHQYPGALTELLPGQLTSIPKNYFGFTWRDYVYHKTGNSFDLKVETGKSTGMVWLSSQQAWDHYD